MKLYILYCLLLLYSYSCLPHLHSPNANLLSESTNHGDIEKLERIKKRIKYLKRRVNVNQSRDGDTSNDEKETNYSNASESKKTDEKDKSSQEESQKTKTLKSKIQSIHRDHAIQMKQLIKIKDERIHRFSEEAQNKLAKAKQIFVKRLKRSKTLYHQAKKKIQSFQLQQMRLLKQDALKFKRHRNLLIKSDKKMNIKISALRKELIHVGWKLKNAEKRLPKYNIKSLMAVRRAKKRMNSRLRKITLIAKASMAHIEHSHQETLKKIGIVYKKDIFRISKEHKLRISKIIKDYQKKEGNATKDYDYSKQRVVNMTKNALESQQESYRKSKLKLIENESELLQHARNISSEHESMLAEFVKESDAIRDKYLQWEKTLLTEKEELDKKEEHVFQLREKAFHEEEDAHKKFIKIKYELLTELLKKKIHHISKNSGKVDGMLDTVWKSYKNALNKSLQDEIPSKRPAS